MLQSTYFYNLIFDHEKYCIASPWHLHKILDHHINCRVTDRRDAIFHLYSCKAILSQGSYKICCPDHWSSGIFIRPAGESTGYYSCSNTKPSTTTTTSTTSYASTIKRTASITAAASTPFTTIQLNTATTTTTAISALEAALNSSTNKTSDLVTINSSKRGGTTAAIVLAVVLLVGVGVFWGRRQWLAHNAESNRREQALSELNGGGGIEMVDNPLRRGGGRGAGAGGGVGTGAVAVADAGDGDGDGDGAVDNDAHAPIYDPPAGLPPAQASPAYYASVAAAPGTVAEYVAPNELGGSAVYSGAEAGDVAAAYASPNEGGSTVYARAGSGGSAAAYTPITNASSMYAPSGDVVSTVGVSNDGALYTNDAYGNVPGSSTTNT